MNRYKFSFIKNDNKETDIIKEKTISDAVKLLYVKHDFVNIIDVDLDQPNNIISKKELSY